MDDSDKTLVRVPRTEVIVKVSNSTPVHKLATAIQRFHEEGNRVVVSCIGVQTVNQAVKAVAIANGKVASNGYVFLLLPFFHMEKKADDVEHNVTRFTVVKHMIGD